MADESCVESAAVRNLCDSWSRTDFPVHTVSHRWTISNFRALCKSGSVLESAHFSGGTTKWYLELNLSQGAATLARQSPTSHGANTRAGYQRTTRVPMVANPMVQIKLIQEDSGKHQMVVDYTLSIVSQSPEFECKQTSFYLATDTVTPGPGARETAPRTSSANLITQSDLLSTRAKDLLVNDALTILCELTLSFISDKRTVSHLPGALENNLGSDLGALLEDTELSDITLVVGKKEFPAHRNILSARSPVFKAMFQHDMREKTESRLDISDLNADTVQGMLQWIYTGRLPSTEQKSKDLLCASDKYSLEPLKAACERSLCQSLSVSNAVDLFELADLHRAACLKSNCMIVITAHSEEVKATERWQQLKRERVDLLVEFLTMFLDL